MPGGIAIEAKISALLVFLAGVALLALTLTKVGAKGVKSVVNALGIAKYPTKFSKPQGFFEKDGDNRSTLAPLTEEKIAKINAIIANQDCPA